MVKWSSDQLASTGIKKAARRPTRRLQKRSKEKDAIEMILKASGLEYTTEYKFLPHRKFRFDWAIPSLMIGIEYEGLFSSKSRHTTINGYVNDCRKYNLAQLHGWRVLRYTAKNYGELVPDLASIENPPICTHDQNV